MVVVWGKWSEADVESFELEALCGRDPEWRRREEPAAEILSLGAYYVSLSPGGILPERDCPARQSTAYLPS